MSLWDSLAPVARDSGAIAGLEDLLRDVGVTTSSTDEAGTPPTRHITASWSPSGGRPLSFDPGRGSFALSSAGTSGTPLEFPDPTVSLDVRMELDAPGGDPTGPFVARLTVPSAVIRLPFLRGARLDSTGMLEPDPAHPVVRFVLPRLTIEATYRDAGSGLSTRLASASSAPATPGATDPADLYDFVRMEPGYALIGPGAVVGFAFRTAALDLSATSNPPGGAHAMPVDWQGLWLPEARLFVAPSGMEGLAVSAGVEDLWIGFGVHAGITGTFEAEVVNRGSTHPTVRVRFQDQDGRWYGTTGDTAALPESTTVFVDAGGSLAPFTSSITVDGTATAGDRVAVTTPTAGSVTVTVSVTDGLGHASVPRTITCTRRVAAQGAPPPGTSPALIATTSTTGTRLRVVGETGADVTLALDPEGGDVAWSWAGGSAAGAQAAVPLAAGAFLAVTAVRSRAAAAPVTFDCSWIVDHPGPAEDGLPGAETYAYSLNPANTSTAPALTDGSDFSPGALPFQNADLRARLQALPPGTTFVVDGYASVDPSGPRPGANLALSQRRLRGLKKILETLLPGASVSEGVAHGEVGTLAQRNLNWRASAVATPPAASTEPVTGVVSRPATPPELPAQRDPQPVRAPVPDCFHKIGVKVELVRSRFVRAEVYGEFDVQTAAERRLAANGQGTLPARTNPQDGVCTFLARLRIDETAGRWDVLAEFRAARGDIDGLAQLTRSTTGGNAGLDALGAVAALAPVLAAATPPSPTAGELVGLAVATTAVAAVGAAGVITVQSVTLHGAEVRVVDGPEGTSVALLLDVVTKLSFDLVLIRVRPDQPITTRYHAVGLKTTWDTVPGAGGVDFVPVWMFDPTAGYSLDVPTGALVARDPFGDLLRVLGFRVSRDNPAYLEAEVGVGVDLGIVTIDAVRVRVRVDALEAPQITAFGASVDVPGTLHGSGYLSLPPEGGLIGLIDLTLLPLSIRIAAAVKIESKDGVTGVFVGMEVEFPVPIVLGNSGLGIFGFLGGVGVNFERAEDTTVPVPALRWLEQQMPRPLGVLNPTGWRAAPGKYAIAAGILLGTLEGGYVVHLKGIVILELPGPRLLFVMKADVLKVPPALRGSESATFLAVLDIDFGRGTITIGLVAEYDIPVLLHVRVPVTAFFSTTDVPAWFVDLGTWREPVTLKVFTTFEGTGYLMVHGKSIAPPPPALASVVTSGLTIAAGVHVQFVWGSTDVGLYLRIAGGFDAIISFAPFAFGGVIRIEGELRLFIVSIGASAELTVLSGHGVDSTGTVVDRTYIHGEVCGHVDFFFFSVEGCVGFELGSNDVPDPDPEPLVKGVVLVSRSPALLEGTATDRAVDGKLGDARDVTRPGDPAPEPVPIDVIPAVLFDVAPDASGLSVFGEPPHGSTGLGADPWIRRGRRWWAYTVDAVELVGTLGTGGAKPSVWWARGGLGAEPRHGPALALLSWLPTATPKAVTYGEKLTTTVTEEWGRVCQRPARPAPVLWTFEDQPAGPSPDGWSLRGVPWPDPPDTYRSDTVRADLLVSERWRCGDPLADVLRGIDPARVLRDAVPCPERRVPEDAGSDPLRWWGSNVPGTPSRRAALDGQGGMRALLETLQEGRPLADARAAVVAAGWDATVDGRKVCDGAILESPVDDGRDPVRRGSQDDADLVKRAWDERGFEPGGLYDAVRVGTPSGLRRFQVLLLVDERGANRGLTVQCLSDTSKVLESRPVTSGDIVSSGHPLPGEWLDPSGPWFQPLERAGRVCAAMGATTRARLLVLVEVDVAEGTTSVEIGWDPEDFDNDKFVPDAFYVVAAEGLVASEVRRFEWDSTTVTHARDALTTALTEDPDDHALLVPGGSYSVKVTWRAAHSAETNDPPPAAPAGSDYGPPVTQEFAFTAEGSDRVPDRLEPWLVATSPGPKEAGTFCDEPVRIAFSSEAASKLFAAYGTELRAVVRAASGKHPTAPGQAAPGPFPLEGAVLSPAPVSIVSPWEKAARAALPSLPCLPSIGERTTISVATITYAFEPCTDYLLDVVRVPLGAPASADGARVLRVPFTTSRFRSVDELAALFADAPVEHRLLRDRTALDALPDRPVGPQLDAAFTAGGLGVPEVPRYPRVVVLWSAGTPAEPVAVVVEGNEELWRSRLMPIEVTAPPDATDPTHTWWAARPDDWLRPELSTAAVPVGEPASAVATRVVRGPGDTRAVVVLAGGSRGSQLRLDLRHRVDVLSGGADTVAAAVRVTLGRPPWEPAPGEED